MRLSKRIHRVLFLSVFAFLFYSNFSFAQNADQMVREMLSNGYNQVRADRLLANWSQAKHSLVKYAKEYKPDSKEMEVLVKICQNRFQAWEKAGRDAIDDAIKAGYERPIEARVPTGSWKEPLNIDVKADPQTFVKKAATADIDETFFGKVGATEYVAERTNMLYAERALGRKLGSSQADFQAANRVITNGEITAFPRDAQGRYSPEFQEKFPSVVMESYAGREGQAALEVGYLIDKKKGLADIIHYDSKGQVKGVVRNQPAESVIEDLADSRYTNLQRLAKADQDYFHKYLDQVKGKGLSGDDHAEWAAKMLERMAGDETALTGKAHPMLKKAAEVKKTLRTIKDPKARAIELRKVLGDQSLDDFVKSAEDEMERMALRNRQRTAWMLDDDIGRPIKGGRLNTILKGMSLIDDAYMLTDSYLRARDGERVKQVSKTLVTALAADLAGTAVGGAVGSSVGAAAGAAAGQTIGGAAGMAAGFASGAIAAAVAVYVVDGTWEWTEEGVQSMLKGYKGDDAVQKMFLNDNDKIKKFVLMSPNEIKAFIDKEWEDYYQYSGAYIGKGTNDHSEIKKYMLQKAIEQQFLLKKGKLEGEIRGNILRQELEYLVQKMDEGKLTPDELKKIREKFGKNTAQMIEDKLQNDPRYAHYKKTLEKIKDQGGNPGIWDRLKSNFDLRSEQQIIDEVNSRFERILEVKEEIEGSLADFYSQVSDFFGVLREWEEDDQDRLTALFNEASISFSEAKTGLKRLQANIDLFLADLAKTSGRLSDTTDFNYKKGEASAILTQMIQKVEAARGQFSTLEKIMGIKKKVDDGAKKDLEYGDGNMDDEGDDADNIKDDDGTPGFVKKSKESDGEEPVFVKNSGDADEENGGWPAFVKKSDEEMIDDYIREFDAAKDDYTIQAISLETVDVTQGNKHYEKVRDVSAVVVIIRMRGSDHIIDGFQAIELLIEKGYVYSVNGVGYVTSEKFTRFMNGEGADEGEEGDEGENNSDGGGFDLGLGGLFGMEKDESSENCKKARACKAKYGSKLDLPESELNKLHYQEAGVIRDCRMYESWCDTPTMKSSGGINKKQETINEPPPAGFKKCSSVKECYGYLYENYQGGLEKCRQQFGTGTSFTKDGAKAKGIAPGTYEDYDFQRCVGFRSALEGYNRMEGYITKYGGVPEGVSCNDDGCFKINSLGIRTPYELEDF